MTTYSHRNGESAVPTVNGYYFTRNAYGDSSIIVIYDSIQDGQCYQEFGSINWHPLEVLQELEFWGPLVFPFEVHE